MKSYYPLLFVASLCLAMRTRLGAQGIADPCEQSGSALSRNLENPYPGLKEDGSLFDSLRSFNEWPREKKVVALNVTAVAAIAAVGSVSWDYCSSSFHFEDEGWFDPDTKFGGADKMGHAYSAYALSSVYNHIYRTWGYSDEDAILGGALTGWAQMTLIEVGDGFSAEHGFCWQDEAMDAVGAGMAYLRHRFPAIKEALDFRLEWYPSVAFRHGDRSDPFTDYSGQKYLLAIKPDGILRTNSPLLRAVEVHIGYYSRGYTEESRYFSSQNRYTYYGVGLNVTYLLEKLTGHRAGGIFDYIQVPGTYVASSSKLN